MKIKKGDTVQIVTGKDKGKTGRIIKVLTDKKRVVVEGLNLINKHQRPTQENPQGGIVQKEASIHHSNVMLLDKNKPTRIGYKIEKGKKIRYSKKSGGNLN
jgi:large subunit ribosomal protein L24